MRGGGGQAIGIPQITKTPAKLPDPFQITKWILSQNKSGKPVPEDFEAYEEFVEALVAWKLDQPLPHQTAKTKPQYDGFETFEDFIEALISWKITQCLPAFRNLLQRTYEALDRAVESKNAADWREFREILGDWPEPVALVVVDLDGTGNTRTWLFQRIHNGIIGHRDDGTASLFWSEKSGILSWDKESLPAKI